MKKSLLGILSIMILVLSGFGQIKSISGTIRNSVTLEPLPYANIVIKGTYLGGTSNIDGYFYLSGLDHDSIEVVCSYMGYHNFQQKFFFQVETHIIIPIQMQPQTLGGEEVLVEDSLLISPEIRITSQIPGPEQPQNIALMNSENLVNADFSYELLSPIRWLHPSGEYTQYVIDGVPVENTRHLYNVYPAFNLDAVKHIENHQAGNVRQTSTDQVAVTELIYKEGNRAQTDVRAILGLVESGLTTSGPHPAGGSWYFSGRRVDFDAIYSLSTTQTDSVYRKFRPDYYFYDLNGKVTFDISENTKVSGNMYLTFDKLHWLGDRGRSAHSSWYNSFLSSRVQHRFSPRLISVTNIYGKTYHTFMRADRLPMGASMKLDGDFTNSLNTYGVSSQAEYFLGSNNMVSAAFSAEMLNSNLAYVDSSTLKDVRGWVVKVKAGYRYTLPYNLATDVGVQTVYSSFAEKLSVNPSLLVNWEPSNIYNAYFSVVQSSPMIRELSLSNTLSQPLFDILIPADLSLPTLVKLNMSVGGEFMPVIGYTIRGDFFTDLIENPTLMDSSWRGNFSDQSKWQMLYDSGKNIGINLSAEKRTPGIRSMAKYRFSRARLTDSSGAQELLPGHREHEFYLTLDGKFKEKMGYQMDLTLASGKRYFDEGQSWDWSSPYHRIDLSFYREVSWERVNGRVSFKLINLTNSKNLDFDEASWVTNSLQDRAFVLLPFMPTINFDFIF
ncbi:MAG: TonB-dependent receptor [Candidatus Marinimicrobia bacterium]|nr:TonB-dependent receptor [Candidatus Neomarinimicrobiota bacterium]